MDPDVDLLDRLAAQAAWMEWQERYRADAMAGRREP